MEQFKVGDRVRLTGSNWGTSDVTIAPYIGEVVTIAGHNEAGNPVFRYYEEDADSDFEDLLEIDEPDWAGRKLAGGSPTYQDVMDVADIGRKLGVREHTDEQWEEYAKTSSFEQSVRRHTDRMANLLIEKNKAYGDSALNPVRIFSKADRTEQLYTRIDDKISRIQKGTDFAKEDTIDDLIGYLFLLKIAEETA